MNLLEVLKTKANTTKILWERDNKIHTLENKEFWELVARLQEGLKNKGITKNDRVLISLPNSPEWILLDFAILSLGAITVALPIDLSEEKKEALIKRTTPKLIFSQKTLELKKDPKESLKKFLGKNASLKITQINDEIATIIFTSGSSGIPKAVPLSHKNILFNIQNQPFNVLPGTYLSYLPMSHAFERTCGIYNAFYLNLSVCFLDSPKKLSIWLKEIQPAFLLLVPTVLKKMKEKTLEKKTSKLLYKYAPKLLGKILLKRFGGKIQYLICGSAPLSLDLEEFVKKTKLPLYCGYGMSEAGPLIAANTKNKNDLKSVGSPLKGIEVRITDNEVQIKSPGLFLDYLPPDSIGRKGEDWFRTGDGGYIKDGLLYLTGRIDEIIVLANGKKIHPNPIEEQLESKGLNNVILTKKEGYPHALIDSNKPKEEIQEIINEYNAKTEKYAQIRSWKSIPELSIESGHLTPTLKKKRKQIIKEFHEYS